MLLGVEILSRLGLFFLGTTTTLLASLDLGFFHAAARETSFVVWNVKATVTNALHSTENSVTSSRAHETNIEVSLEWASLRFGVSDVPELSIGSSHTDKLAVDFLVLQKSAGKKEASCVSGSVVGKTAFDAVVHKFLRIGSTDCHIALEGRVDNRSKDTLVGETNNQAVLLRVVLILVVNDKSLASVVVRLSLSSAAELSLISFRVCFVLENFHEAHCAVIFFI